MTVSVAPTSLPGVLLLRPEPSRDERGSFTRLSCVATLSGHGVAFKPRQTSLSRSSRRGTLRGLHFQIAPSAEVKIVHCLMGCVFDVVVDLRPNSATFRHWHGIELSAENGLGLLVPAGCAHGLLTLSDNTSMLYQIDRDFDSAHARGVRWDDPAFSIDWPFRPLVVSDRDAAWPDFSP